MKNVIKAYFVFSILTLSMAACTMGDKGEGHVTDSTSMDTTQAGSGGAGGAGGAGGGGMSSGSGGGSGTAGASGSSSDSTATPGTIPRDTTQKDRSSNGAADVKPKK
jgi:hypothetical protein